MLGIAPQCPCNDVMPLELPPHLMGMPCKVTGYEASCRRASVMLEMLGIAPKCPCNDVMPLELPPHLMRMPCKVTGYEASCRRASVMLGIWGIAPKCPCYDVMPPADHEPSKEATNQGVCALRS